MIFLDDGKGELTPTLMFQTELNGTYGLDLNNLDAGYSFFSDHAYPGMQYILW